MSRKKVYELATELAISSKELIEELNKIGIEVKSHLSVLEENQIDKVSKKLMEKKEIEKKVIKKEEKKQQKEEPVIIRRNVIVSDEEVKENKEKRSELNKEVGKVQKNSQKDFNIVYREKKDKPLTVSELFGLNKKEEVKDTEPKEVIGIEEFRKERRNRKLEENMQKQAGNSNKVSKSNKENKDDFEKGKNSFAKRENRENKDFGKPRFDNKKKGEFKDRKDNKNFVKPRFDNKALNKKSEKIEEPKEELFKESKAVERTISRQKDREKEQNKMSEAKTKKNRIKEEGEFDIDNLKSIKNQGNISGIIESGDIFDMYQDDRRKNNKNSKISKNRKAEKEKKKMQQAKLTNIIIEENITVKDLAQALKITSSELLMKLMAQGIVTTLNNSIDFDTAYILASEYGVTATKKNVITFEEKLFDDSTDNEVELEERPPVVVVMGHVDHGKTSLLDAIRNTNKVANEAGGITQHIGAYQVETNGKLITFLDTPGHEAFISMRARGAKATDIAILVVAANDGVMPQTVEAISHAKAANIPIIVAINKMDLPGANVDRIKQEMIEHGLVSEEWGGDTIFVPISAKTGMGIDELLSMVQLQAELLELKANKNKQAKGTVLEARLDKTRGPVVSMLVNRGTLNVGDTIIVGTSIGRIRTMIAHNGESIKEAYPSTPVEVTGINTIPEAGATFYEVSDEKTAKKLIERREREKREKKIGAASAVTLDALFENINKGNVKTLNIVVKADVAGTAEAVKKSLEKLSTEEVSVKVIHANVGAITETDINLAKVANAIVIGFNVRPEHSAKQEAENGGIEIKLYSVIYNAIDDVKNAMIGMLDPEYKEVVIGTVEVRATFKISKVGTIAGSYVTSGLITRNAKVRVIRDNVVLADTSIASLKREKDDAKEVKSGYECGIQLEGFNDILVGDTFEVYKIEEIKRKSLKGN